MLKSFHGFHLTANSTDDDDQISLKMSPALRHYRKCLRPTFQHDSACVFLKISKDWFCILIKENLAHVYSNNN